MDGKTHRKVGTAIGAAAALVSTDDTQELWQRIAEGLGGAIGGNVGARMPDWIEPALHSPLRIAVYQLLFLDRVPAHAASMRPTCASVGMHPSQHARGPSGRGRPRSFWVRPVSRPSLGGCPVSPSSAPSSRSSSR